MKTTSPPFPTNTGEDDVTPILSDYSVIFQNVDGSVAPNDWKNRGEVERKTLVKTTSPNTTKDNTTKPAGRSALASEVFTPTQIEAWKRLCTKVWTTPNVASPVGDPEALLQDEIDVAWPLCGGDEALLRSAAAAALAEVKRAVPKKANSAALTNFFRSVLRTQIGKIKQASQSAAPVRKHKLSRWG